MIFTVTTHDHYYHYFRYYWREPSLLLLPRDIGQTKFTFMSAGNDYTLFSTAL